MFHKIKSVTPLANYRLLVHFTEGCCREYDMTPLIQRMVDCLQRDHRSLTASSNR